MSAPVTWKEKPLPFTFHFSNSSSLPDDNPIAGSKLVALSKIVKLSRYRPERAQRVDRGGVVSITPRPLYPRKRPSTHWRGGWVGPRAGLDRCGKSRPHRDSIPRPSSPQPVAIQIELPGQSCLE
jgi:hypothetical protein